MLKSKVTGDRIVALVLVIFSANLLITSLRYGLFLEDGAPGPGLFPSLITAPLTVFSLAWFVTGEKKQQSRSVAGNPDEIDILTQELEANAETLREIDAAGRKRIGWVLFWSVVFMFLFERIGAILAMILFSLGLLWSIDRRKPWRTLPLTVVLVLLIVLGAKSIGVTLPDPFNLYRIYGNL